ncbi:MAG: sulfite exporter TauE/SafE family protein [Thermoleophilaceae bacterium]
MELADLIGLLAIGFCAGMLGGLVGVGGGVLFVPGLVIFLGLSQIEAEATSLLAILFVATVGAWRQRRYGNLRVRDGLVIGLLSPLGVLVGTVVANAISERALELGFAAVQLFFAWSLTRRALGRANG